MSSLRRAYLQVFSFDMVSKGLMAVSTIALIRYMQPTEFAAYTFALSIAAVVSQTVAAAINRVYIVGVEGLTQQPPSATFLGAQLWGGAILAIAMLPLARYTSGLFALIVGMSVATISLEFAKTFYQRELAFFRLSIVELLRTLLFAAAVALLFVTRHLDAHSVLFVQSGVMACLAVAVFRRIDTRHLLDPRAALGLARAIVSGPSAFVVGYFICTSVLAQLPLIFVRLLRPESLAAFGSAFRYYALLLLALNTAHVVLLPTLQKASTPAELDAVFRRNRPMVALFAFVVAIGAVASRWLIPWIDHGKYPDAVTVFRILAISAVVSFALSPHVNVLLRARRFVFMCVLIVIGTLADAVLLAVLVGRWGMIGAAVTTLVVNATVNLFVWREANRVRALEARLHGA